MLESLAEDTVCFGCRIQINQVRTELESCFLLASIHYVRRPYTRCRTKNVINALPSSGLCTL